MSQPITTTHQLVARAIRLQRIRAGIPSEAELARRAGMSPAGLSKRLSGDLRLTLNEVEALATALGVSPFDLMAPVAQDAPGESATVNASEALAGDCRPVPGAEASSARRCPAWCQEDSLDDDGSPWLHLRSVQITPIVSVEMSEPVDGAEPVGFHVEQTLARDMTPDEATAVAHALLELVALSRS